MFKRIARKKRTIKRNASNRVKLQSVAELTPRRVPLVTSESRRKLPQASDAVRFLNQATMGANRTLIARLQAIGYSAWLDEQFSIPLQESRYTWMTRHSDPATGKPYTNIDFQFDDHGMDQALWHKLLNGSDALRQRVAFALSEIIVVSLNGLSGYWPQFRAAAYMDLLEAHAFGNFRNLLQGISTNAAMGQYLTFLNNKKHNPTTGSNPDENYARELLQLFTIGLYQLNLDGTPKLVNGEKVEAYTQSDISQLARIFTGWQWDPPNVSDRTEPSFAIRSLVPNENWHETGASTFLGGTVPAGLNAATSLTMALDIIFSHSNVGPFISKQLIQKLVTSNPSPNYVARVAQVFNNNGSGVKGDMKAVIRAILLDDEARNRINLTNPQAGKVREPILRFTAWARLFNAYSPNDTWDVGWVVNQDWGLGQGPMRSPTVFNFYRPGYVPPNSGVATAGLVAPEMQMANETSVVGYINFMTYAVYSFSTLATAQDKFANMDVDYSSLRPLTSNPVALVNELNLLLTANQLSSATVTTIVNAISQIDYGLDYRIYAALLLILASPEFIVSK